MALSLPKPTTPKASAAKIEANDCSASNISFYDVTTVRNLSSTAIATHPESHPVEG
jgi:hypothetical protein